MAITQFLHVSICVSDPAKSVPFYRDILGFKLVAEQHYTGEGPSTVMDVPGSDLTVYLMTHETGYRLELMHWKTPTSKPMVHKPKTNHLGLSHLTVGVDDPEKTIRELRAKGVKVLEHTRGSFVPGMPTSQFLFEDPDGFLIETYTAPKGGPLPYP
jgi:catechol 2,3-dioxygenase-like lactoylglutathione lyase family enzyme